MRLHINLDFKEVIFNSGITFFFKIIGLFLAYLVTLLITKTFGSEVFGRYSIVITFSQLIVLVFTFGLPSVIILLITDQNHFDKRPKTNFLKKIMLITLVSSVLITIVIYSLSEIIALKVFNDQSLIEYFKTLSFFIIPLMFHEVLLNFFRGKKEFKKFNFFLFVLPPLLFLGIFYGFLNINQKEIITILSFGLSAVIVFLLEIFFYGRLKYSTKTDYSTKTLFKLSFPMMLSGTILFLLNWTDIFMLGAMVSSKEVGVYNLAFKIASIGLIILIVINVVIGPKIAELYNKNDLQSLQKTIVKTTQLIALLTLPIVVVIIVFRAEILSFFGQDFILGESTLIILSFGILINALAGKG